MKTWSKRLVIDSMTTDEIRIILSDYSVSD
jgi:hypothetical protein